jgi:hypothetical protein
MAVWGLGCKFKLPERKSAVDKEDKKTTEKRGEHEMDKEIR